MKTAIKCVMKIEIHTISEIEAKFYHSFEKGILVWYVSEMHFLKIITYGNQRFQNARKVF